MNKFLSRTAIVLLTLMVASSVALAQSALDPDSPPNFGSVELPAGFQPDPYIVTIVSGGDIDVSTEKLGAVCTGFVSSAPDFNFERTGQSSLLRLFFVSSAGDTTLIVRNPAGQYNCNDDFEGLDPLVEFANPAEGTYSVWVGSYTSGEFNPGYLMASELSSSPEAIISPVLRVTSDGSSTNGSTSDTTGGIQGLLEFPNLSVNHVNGNVDYPQTPPAGGPHNPTWLTCGVYFEPVPDENAVHSMEHGAVWITYNPDLPADEVQQLADITEQSDHRLLSPYPNLPSPIVVSAWGFQLSLQSADDPRLMQFIQEYESGPTTPERGAPC